LTLACNLFPVSRYEPEYQITFGRHLRELREGRNWTQLDLSAYSEVNETQISKIENGEVGPNLQTIRVLAVALGMYPRELLDFDYPLVFNTDFSSSHKRNKKANTTALVRELLRDNFFDSPRSVADVIVECRTRYNTNLASDDTSGVLLMLVRHNELRKAPSNKKKGRNVYMK